MTLKEAIKILKKEGFHMILEKKIIYQDGAIREFEKQEVCEAIKVANENRLTVGLTPTEWHEREDRLKKEYEQNTKSPGPGEEQPKEKVREVDSKDLHLALSTMKIGERLSVRFDGSKK